MAQRCWLRSALPSGAGCSSSRSEPRFGAGGTGGNYYAYANALGQLLEDQSDELRVDVKGDGGQCRQSASAE